MSTQRIGLLGAGYIVKSHAKAIQGVGGATLHAVCDRAAGRARATAEEFGIPHVFDSIEALAASDCDAVHVLLPPSLHVPAARQLIEAGKSVFLEKPMGTDAQSCRDLAALAAERRVRLGVNHNFLFSRAYERIRDTVKGREVGEIDHLTLNWLFELPQLQFGPFDIWMLAEPRNLVLELGSHLAAFALDLLGTVDIVAAHADAAIALPGDKRAFRKWTAIGKSGRASLTINISLTPGRVERSLSLRALGMTAHLDFHKGVAWTEQQASDNPIFDDFTNSRRIAKSLRASAYGDVRQYLARALRKAPAGNPFEDSILRSIDAFYRPGPVDPRHDAGFGAEVIALCETIAERAGVNSPAPAAAASAQEQAPAEPRVLVVGGTGFIGKRLVDSLVRRGHAVRVLTRNANAARLELGGPGVEVMQGSHGDAATLDRALQGIDIVYHLAKAEGKRWADYVANDIEPTRALADAALRHGIKRFVYTGTIDSYSSDNASVRITGETPLDSALRGRNLYAQSKAACEALLRQKAETQGLPLVIARPGIVIGRDSPPWHLGVAQFVSPTHVRFWGDGANKLPFILVEDVADALAIAADAPGIEGKSLLLTDAPLMSAQDYVDEVAAYSGTSIRTEQRPTWRYWISDWVKEQVKTLVRHPNRRRSTLHDWGCRSHRAVYDSTSTQVLLGWKPAGTSEALIERGIRASVDRFMR